MTAVKLAIVVVAIVASLPAGRWLERHPRWRLHLWALVGFLPFLARGDLGIVPWDRPGDTNGIEVALIDWLALSLYLAHRGRTRPTPYRIALGLYLLAALIPITYAEWPLGAFAYVWKVCRMYLLYAAICRAGDDERVPAALLRGLAFGIVYESVWTIWQHFGLGIHRAPGTFVHENTLGMLVNLTVMVPIALIIAGRASRLAWLAAIAALPNCIFTVSRGTILFFAVGTALVYLVSVLRSYDTRKAKLGLIGLALAAALAPVAVATLGTRSVGERDESMQTRRQFERAAALMLEDHPLGVGPNHFVVMLFSRGYGDRADLHWSQRISIVHNVYWLTAAEMGYPGIIALVVLFLGPLLSAFRWGLRAHQDHRSEILVGLAVGLTLFYVHSFFEWTWRLAEVSYVYWMVVGITATLARQLGESRLRHPVPVRALRMARRDARTGSVATFAQP